MSWRSRALLTVTVTRQSPTPPGSGRASQTTSNNPAWCRPSDAAFALVRHSSIVPLASHVAVVSRSLSATARALVASRPTAPASATEATAIETSTSTRVLPESVRGFTKGVYCNSGTSHHLSFPGGSLTTSQILPTTPGVVCQKLSEHQQAEVPGEQGFAEQ